jgi:hypothetical protein
MMIKGFNEIKREKRKKKKYPKCVEDSRSSSNGQMSVVWSLKLWRDDDEALRE